MVPSHFLSDEDTQSSNTESKKNEENDTSSDETSKSILSPSGSSASRPISPSNASSCSDLESVNNNDYSLSEDKHNIFPINLSERNNDIERSKSFVPRTVPCVVLSQSTETINSNLFQVSPNYCLPPSPLESIMTKISKLSNPDSSYFNRIFTGNLTNRSDNNCDATSNPKMECQKNLNNNQLNESTQTFGKLSFGIDRILSQDFHRKQDELEAKNRPQDPDFLARTHQHHPNSISSCSDCILLSRFYRYQMSNSSRNYSATTWSQHQHIFESSGSLLSPGGGYTHHQHSALPQFGVNLSGYSSISPMISCNSHSNPRRKRSWSRAVFSNLQRKGLEKRFQIQKYITKPDRRQLAATLGLTDAQVKVWFQNRRMKWRHTKEGKSGLTESSSTHSSNNNKFNSQSQSLASKK